MFNLKLGMMNKLISGILLLICVGCSTDETSETSDQKEFLVDKIFDYNDNLLADYIYNDNHQLVKRLTTNPVNDNSWDYEFDYEHNKISKIKYIDHNFPEFNHTIKIYYSTEGRIIKDETYKGDILVGVKNYTYYPDGKIKGIVDANGEENITFLYHDTPNIEQVKILVPDNGDITTNRNYIEVFYNYTYDDGKKPDFGIGDIFQFEPLPFRTEATLVKNISQNNITGFLESGTVCIYEYNEFNLPTTIETKWSGVVTEEPMLLKITYKEID